MTLLNFRNRVYRRILDLGTLHSRYNDDIRFYELLDDFINEKWPLLVKKDMDYYRKVHTDITGITDAVVGSSSERYILPIDFRAAGALRRADITGLPIVPLTYDLISQDDERNLPYFPLVRDPAVPSSSGESWSIYSATTFQIIPAPTATSYKYRLFYFRQHVLADADGETVDIPDICLPYCLTGMEVELLSRDLDPVAQKMVDKLKESMGSFVTVDKKLTSGAVNDVQRFW